jgi:DNA helicase-2/ATP-dependent DNA helicase PcrA
LFSKESIVGISNFLLLLDYSIKKVKDGRSIGEILYDFIKDSGYIDSFLNEESTENLFAVSNIQKFFDLIKNYEKENPDSNIYEYVDYLNYCIEVGESPLVDQVDLEDVNAVNILTVHASKGLEFPIVFLSNLVSERFPSMNRSDVIPIPEDLIKEEMPVKLDDKEAHIQEERRLFYVGATRAKHRLYLTAANYYGNAKRRKKPSIFLYEILDRDISEEFLINEKGKDRDFEVVHEEDDHSLLPDNLNVNLVKKLSYSQIHVFEDCPKKYEYAYVLRVPQKPSSAMSFGSTVHNTLKSFYEELKRSKEGLGIIKPPDENLLLELYEKNWVGFGYDSSVHEKTRKEAGIEIMKEYYKNLYSEEENPYMLEESFSVHMGDTVFSGKIDRMDLVRVGESGIPEVEIIDYKTGKVKNASVIKNDLQLPLYAIFAEEKLGVKVVGAKYVFVEHGEIIEVDVSQKRREKSRDLIPGIVESISKREFLATPGWLCKFCDYNSVCKDAEL